jgi:hypothetical protein
MYDDRWTVEQARSAIEEGHRLYTVNPSTGERLDLELFGRGLRFRQGQANATTNRLDDLPSCG